MQGAAGDGTSTMTRPNFRFENAKDLFEQIPEAEEDITTPPGEHDAAAFAHMLVESEIPEESLMFCAYLLPRRMAVWWGHECLMNIEPVLDDNDRFMLQLAAAWVANPREDERYAALDAAMDSSAKTAGVWLALGAGWAGGSMSGADLPPVPPPPYLTARAVNGAILSGLARGPLEARKETMDRFVRMAMRLGEGS